MNGGEQDSGKSVWHSELSATVPEFVPRIARIKVTSSGDLVINSNLSPLVPEFHPSVSPGSSPPRSVHGLQQPSKQPCVNLHQAYQTTFPPSMKNILVKAESSGSEKRKDGNCEGHAVVASGTDESSTENSVKVKKKKKQRKKNESSGLITKQENTGVPVSCDTITGDQLHLDASLNDGNSARSKAKEVSSSTQENDILLLSHHENSSANTDSTVTANFGCCNTVNQPSSFKEPFALSTLTVSYSDKVKSSSPKGNSTGNHLGAEKTKTNHFTSESFKRKDKPVDLKKRSEFCHSQSPGTVSSNKDGKKPVKSGQKSDDSSWKTVCRDNDDNKLKDVDSSRSQSTDAKHNQRTVKQMRRNGSFKKTTCDDDDNWRVRKDVDPTSVSCKKEINKSNIKDSDTGSLEKRTCYQEEKIIDLISNGCQDLKHENVVGHKVVHKKGIASKKLQNFHSIDPSGTEFTQSSSFLISKARSDVSEDIQEHGIKPIRMSTIPDADSNLVMAEFPEFKESVKVKRLSITAGGTMDHKDEVTSPKATAPLSYSAVLRSPPQLKVMHAWENESASKTCGGRLKVPPPQTTMTEVESESNQEESNEKKKKKKKKKKKTGETKEQTQESGSTRRTQKPIQFDLGVMLQTITKSSSDKPQQSNKKLVISTGVLPSQLSVTVSPDMKPVKAFPQLKGENKSIPHNTLDSTAPVVKRGKERETPARKKPSALKKIILKEREEKKKAKKTTETGDADKTSDEKENITFEAEGKVTIQEIQNTLEDDAVTQVDSKPSSPTHQEIAAEIHSRRFREYCFQVPDKEVDGVATDLLRELVRFQDRQFHKDPVKAKAKRRFVLGLREVHKHLKLRRLKCVIISSNVERIQSSGGLDDTLGSIINLCRENNVPVVFALKRQMLGRVLLKKVPVSIVGIFNYDGAQDHFKKLIELTQKTKQAYTDRWEETREKLELQQQETSGVKTAEMDMVPNAGLQQAGVQHTTKEAAESTDDEESDANKENDSDSERDVFIENELEIQDL